MATTNNSTGRIKFADDFFIKSLYEGKTRSTTGVVTDATVHQETYHAPTIAGSSFVSSGTSCTWSANGTVTADKKSVTLGKYYIQHEQCYKDWLKNIENEEGVPSKAIDALEKLASDDIMSNSSYGSEVVDWLGRISGSLSAYSGATLVRAQTDGIVMQLIGNAVTGHNVTMTKANVVSKFEAAELLANTAIQALAASKENELVFFCSPKTEKLYKQALSSQGINTTDKAYIAYHSGIEVRGVPGLAGAPNLIVYGRRSDLQFVSNTAVAGQAQIDVKDMYESQLIQVVRMASTYRYGNVVTNPGDFVLYGIA